MTPDDPEGPPLTPEEEALLRATIERGLERYKGIAPPEMIELMRRAGQDGLRTHPLTRGLIGRLGRRAAVPDRSGDLPTGRGGAKGGPESGQGGS